MLLKFLLKYAPLLSKARANAANLTSKKYRYTHFQNNILIHNLKINKLLLTLLFFYISFFQSIGKKYKF